ncbi:MAG: DUF5652 family protein [Candidatus Peribacteraceae bacterium]
MMNTFNTQDPSFWMLWMVPLIAIFVLLVITDAVFKAWGMWRAARMGKMGLFIALLLVNSLGILPGIFFLLTKEEYRKGKHHKR